MSDEQSKDIILKELEKTPPQTTVNIGKVDAPAVPDERKRQDQSEGTSSGSGTGG